MDDALRRKVGNHDCYKNIGEKLWYLRLGEEFLDLTSKALSTKGNILKSMPSKFKTFVLQTWEDNEDTSLQTGRKHLQSIYLTKSCVKNIHISSKTQQENKQTDKNRLITK